MKLLQFAVASVVDANTGYGLTHNGGSIGYATAAQHGHTIRAKSIVAVYRLIKDQVGHAISSYRASVRKQRQIAALAQLDDRLLRDIGLSREDVFALQAGQATLEQLDAERRPEHLKELPFPSTTARIGQHSQQLDAVNAAVFAGKKCA
jgi:uncharacterized protein YjiS (DUF1127 family)